MAIRLLDFLLTTTLIEVLAAQCDCPSGIPNAEVQYTELHQGDTARYTCVDGYTSLDSFVERRCLNDNSWSLESLECRPICTDGQFQCPSGSCISSSWQCDGDNDCGDLADEADCPSKCANDQFECPSRSCIPDYWVCDNYNDCGDNADEAGCPCLDSQIRCPTGQCISSSWLCDGDNDCGDYSDENNCRSWTIVVHTSYESPANADAYLYLTLFEDDGLSVTTPLLDTPENDFEPGAADVFSFLLISSSPHKIRVWSPDTTSGNAWLLNKDVMTDFFKKQGVCNIAWMIAMYINSSTQYSPALDNNHLATADISEITNTPASTIAITEASVLPADITTAELLKLVRPHSQVLNDLWVEGFVGGKHTVRYTLEECSGVIKGA
ncbi:hypothetical protein ScPMuIL_007181 [Solemya velum]